VALTLTNPIEIETIFIELDPTGEFKASFRQANASVVQRRDRIVFSQQHRYLGIDGVGITGTMPWSERQMYECMITMTGCHGLNDHKGRPLFRFSNGKLAMDDHEFVTAWGKINIPGVTDALHGACLKANPDWDYERTDDEEEEDDEGPPPVGEQGEE
jgi:hypothetical protein